MAGRIIVFGATGYTGELVVRSLIALGVHPVLAARSPERLDRLSHAHGGLETQIADVDRPRTVRALVERGDVLVSTVGPFARWGDAAAEAAIDAGAHYFDSTGEPSFIRRVFDHYGPRARAAGSAMFTSFGFDWVPGNLVGATALSEAGDDAVQLDIGYFSRGGAGISGGTAASTLGVMLAPSFRYLGGKMHTERAGARVRSFEVDVGRRMRAVSVGGSEHYGLPPIHPSLSAINVFLGRPGKATAVTPLITGALSIASALPPLRSALEAAVHRRGGGSTGGPDDRQRAGGSCTILAEARSADGHLVQRTRFDGPNGYTFTADILAWAAARAAQNGFTETGALGPVAGFGLRELTAGAAQAGLTRTGSDPAVPTGRST